MHRYFAPDTPPYANMLRGIAGSLAARGHDVQVLTCQPSYRRDVVRGAPRTERMDGFSVVRWPVLDDRRSTARKVINLAWFSLRLLQARRRFMRADVVMAASTPPVFVALVCSAIARSVDARFVYHKQDIWPEVSGVNRGWRGLGARLLRRLDHGTERRAARVVVLSTDMADTVRARSHHRVATEVLNNFDPWRVPEDPADGAERPDLTLAFAGSLGRFQGLELLNKLIDLTRDDPRIDWHFYGDGPMASHLQRMVESGARVTLHGYRPAAEVAEFLRDRADLGVISLNPGVIRSAYPSKTMSYLRNGCPLVAIVEADSELARMIREERIGVTGGHQEIAGLADDLRRLAGDPAELRAARKRAAEVYVERFAVERQLERWGRLVEAVAR